MRRAFWGRVVIALLRFHVSETITLRWDFYCLIKIWAFLWCFSRKEAGSHRTRVIFPDFLALLVCFNLHTILPGNTRCISLFWFAFLGIIECLLFVTKTIFLSHGMIWFALHFNVRKSHFRPLFLAFSVATFSHINPLWMLFVYWRTSPLPLLRRSVVETIFPRTLLDSSPNDLLHTIGNLSSTPIALWKTEIIALICKL